MYFTIYVAFPSCVSDSGRERSASCQTRNSTQTAGPYREHHPVSSRGPAGHLTQTTEPLTLSQHWQTRAERTGLTDTNSPDFHMCAAFLLDPPQVHLLLQICCPLNRQCWHCQNRTGSDCAWAREVRMMAEWHTCVTDTFWVFILYVSPCEINIPFAFKYEDTVREERCGSEWRSVNDCAVTPERLEEEHQICFIRSRAVNLMKPVKNMPRSYFTPKWGNYILLQENVSLFEAYYILTQWHCFCYNQVISPELQVNIYSYIYSFCNDPDIFLF